MKRLIHILAALAAIEIAAVLILAPFRRHGDDFDGWIVP